jgi:hypothetical protein
VPLVSASMSSLGRGMLPIGSVGSAIPRSFAYRLGECAT